MLSFVVQDGLWDSPAALATLDRLVRQVAPAVGGLPMPAGLVASTAAVEIAVHGWDVSQSRGGGQPIPAGLAAITFTRETGEIGVHVGLGETHPSMGELSLIGVPVTLASGISAVIAVLGPMRMNYVRVMSAVQHVGQAFRDA